MKLSEYIAKSLMRLDWGEHWLVLVWKNGEMEILRESFYDNSPENAPDYIFRRDDYGILSFTPKDKEGFETFLATIEAQM